MRDSLDLLLDAAGDAAVRADWAALAAAEVPSSGDREADDHAPHVTIAERDEVAPEVDAALGVLVERLPLALVLGPPVVLGAADRRFVARTVVPTAELLSLHAAAAELLGPGGPPHGAVGEWLPHVTVSGRLRDDGVTAALGALGPAYGVRAVRLRRWYPRERVVRDL